MDFRRSLALALFAALVVVGTVQAQQPARAPNALEKAVEKGKGLLGGAKAAPAETKAQRATYQEPISAARGAGNRVTSASIKQATTAAARAKTARATRPHTLSEYMSWERP